MHLNGLKHALTDFKDTHQGNIIFPVPQGTAYFQLPKNITSLFEHFNYVLRVTDLVINGAVITAPSPLTQVTVTGTATLWQPSVTITANFTENTEGLQLVLQVGLPENWTFSTSFPSLSGAVLNHLVYQKNTASFFFCSTAQPDYQPDIDLQVGINFYAAVDLTQQALANVGMLSKQQSTVIYGSIQPPDPSSLAPKIALKGYQTLSQLDFQPLVSTNTPSMLLREAHFFIEGAYNTAGNEYQSSIYLTGQWEIYSTRSSTTGLLLSLSNSRLTISDILSLSFNLPPKASQAITFSTLDQLTGSSIETAIRMLKTMSALSLTQLSAQISVTQKQLQTFDFTLGTTKPWTLIPNLAELDQLKLQFRVFNPFTNNQLFLNFAGAFTFVDSLDIALSAQYPDLLGFMIEGKLQPSQHFSLKEMADYIGKELPVLQSAIKPIAHLTDISLPTARFIFSEQQFSMSASIANDSGWQMIPGFTRLTLKSATVNLTIAQTAGQRNATAYNISYSVASVLSLAASNNKTIDFTLSAFHPGHSQGWVFNGASNSAASIADLLHAGEQLFRVSTDVKVPTIINKTILEYVQLSFNTASLDFRFACAFNVPILDKEFSAQLDFQKNSITKTAQVTGHFRLANQRFGFALDKSSSASQMTAYADSVVLSGLIADLFSELDIDFSHLPTITLSDINLTYNTASTASLDIKANYTLEEDRGSFELAARKNATTQSWEFAAALQFDLANAIDLGQLVPVIGPALKGDFTLNHPLIVITSRNPAGISFSQPHLGHITQVIPGATFILDLTLEGDTTSVTLPIFRYGNTQTTSSNTLVLANQNNAITPATPNNPTGSIPIGKQIGPVYIQSIQPQYKNNGNISLGVTACATIGPLSGALYNLYININSNDFSEVQVGIDGLDLAYKTATMTIQGTFVKIANKNAFSGECMVRAGEVSWVAQGDYGNDNGNIYFYLFSILDYPIGGPPFMYITGLTGGIGYNTRLNIPQEVDKIKSFPFVLAAQSIIDPTVQNPFAPGSSPAQNYAVLANTNPPAITEQIGEYWGACGLTFTTFETINAFAMAALSFGRSLTVNVVGVSVMDLPTGDSDPVAHIVLYLDAGFHPAMGLFKFALSIDSTSYVFDKHAHLTGDFVMAFWFSPNQHAGDFLVTLGGYHPEYKPPAYYPQNLKRLGLDWQIDNHAHISGGLYFALTPVAVMVGGNMQAVWHSGPFAAGLNFWTNFLLEWKPFHYDVSMSIQIWASAQIWLVFTTKTLTIHLGVDVYLWGPKFAGMADVDLDIVSFTIAFGAASRSKLPGISWYQFIDQFFAKNKSNNNLSHITTGDVTSGLKQRISDEEGALLHWIVSADEAVFTTTTQIPATGVSDQLLHLVNTQSMIKTDKAPKVYVRPLSPGKAPELQSMHHVSIERVALAEDILLGNVLTTTTLLAASDFNYTPITTNIPSAIWSNYNDEQRKQGRNNTIQNVLSGLTVQPTHQQPDTTLPIAQSVLAYEYSLKTRDPLFNYFDMAMIAQTPPAGSVASTINSATTQAKRNVLVKTMQTHFHWSTLPVIDVSVFGNTNVVSLYDTPINRVLGYREIAS